ncbi:MAG: elongation factor P--(R)-beta-lysine ligase [Aestuariibacter sp.]
MTDMTKQCQWQPTAPLINLHTRAEMLSAIRSFFAKRNVLEVETPLLASAPVTDPHLVNFESSFASPLSPEQQSLYLQTSPEYAMKRLLAAGSGCIFQICKAFRNEEAGRYHNPEFTMLEWYRVGFDHWQLMAEISTLVGELLSCPAAEQISYQEVFIQYLDIDPLESDLQRVKSACNKLGFAELAAEEDNKDTLLQLLFSHCIEPEIGQDKPSLIYHFPASQSALARISKNDPRVAQRFELYFKGIELANGFNELTDATEQAQRFASDNQQRLKLGRTKATIDERFLAALQAGLPNCAGVALGLDRLLMLKTGADNISETIAFDISRA